MHISDFRKQRPAALADITAFLKACGAGKRVAGDSGLRPLFTSPQAMSQRADAGAVYLRSIASRTERRVAPGSRAG